jgi:hypothetical protein
VESYWHGRGIVIGRQKLQSKNVTVHTLGITSASGGISISWGSIRADRSQMPKGTFLGQPGEWRFLPGSGPAQGYPHLYRKGAPGVGPGHEGFGFAFIYDEFLPETPSGDYGHQWQLILPYPAVWLLSAAITAIFGFLWFRRRQQNREGLCPRCGYDLRAHRPGQKCPECGTLIQRLPEESQG